MKAEIARLSACFLSAVVTRGISSAVVPLMMVTLSAEQVGLYSLSTMIISLGSVIAPLGFRQLIVPLYLEQPPEHRRAFVVTFATITGVIACAMAGAMGVLLWLMQPVYREYVGVLVVVMFTCIMFYANDLIMQLLAVRDNMRELLMIQFAGAALAGLGSVAALFWSADPLRNVLISQASSYGVAPIFIGSRALARGWWREISVPFGITVVKKYWLSALASIPFIVRPLLFSTTSRMLIAYRGGLALMGRYAGVELVGSLFQFGVMQPLNQAYFPGMMRSFSAPEKRASAFVRHVMILLGLSGIIAGGALLVWAIVPVAYYHDYVPSAAHGVLFLCIVGTQLMLMATAFMSSFIVIFNKNILLSGAVAGGLVAQVLAFVVMKTEEPILTVVVAGFLGATVFCASTAGYAWHLYQRECVYEK